MIRIGKVLVSLMSIMLCIILYKAYIHIQVYNLFFYKLFFVIIHVTKMFKLSAFHYIRDTFYNLIQTSRQSELDILVKTLNVEVVVFAPYFRVAAVRTVSVWGNLFTMYRLKVTLVPLGT